MLLSLLKSHYEERKVLLQEIGKKQNMKLILFDVHDAKMIYNIMQYSLWNRKYHPFLLCKCLKGESVVNLENHTCVLITDEESEKLHDKSKKRFADKFNNEMTLSNEEKHREWCDKHNFGITHFGLHPSLMPPSSIAFDSLHCRLSNVRQIMGFVRKYLERFGYEIQEEFAAILKLQLGEYYVLCYQLNKNLAVMHGEQIEQYLQLIPNIIRFLQTKLAPTMTLSHIITLLTYYPLLDKFLRITKVIDTNSSLEEQDKQKNDYELKIIEFKNNLLIYKKAAAQTILSKNAIGDSENFYSHVLFNYYPKLIIKVWNEYKVGVGVFNLQGFERRNKESKNAAKCFYNGKHNICTQTMNRMHDHWYYS